MARAHSRYIPSLDGLRAFAVLSVIAYHMGFNWAQGGLLGVTVFFVLSGYLITGLLIAEYRESHTIDLPNFWLRRIRRLVPAIVFVVLGVGLLCVIFNHGLLTKMRPDIPSSLFFYSNWWQIFHNISYFQAIGSPSPLQHFWSLAIEEQFYLIWPVLLLFLFKLGVKSKPLRRGILIAAAVSVVEMALLYSPDVDPSRVYYGTDTRAFSLLIGAWLAFVWPASSLTEESGRALPRETRIAFDGAGIAALVGLMLMVAFANGFSPFLYRGGILLCSVLTAVVIAVIVHPISVLARGLACKPLVWIGKRSYGMYLWHYPILLLMTNRNTTSATPLWWNALELAIIVGISAFSYKFIENPVRHGALEDWVRNVRAGKINLQTYVQNHVAPVACGTALVLVSVIGMAVVPDVDGIGGMAQLQEAAAQQEDSPHVDEVTSAANTEVYDVTLIGDSVTVRIVPDFEQVFPLGLIDSAVNRQFSEGLFVFDQYRDAGCIGGTVVFALGTNGVVTAEQLNQMVADVGSDKDIYLVTTRSPQDWVETTNNALANTAAKYDNVYLIDWYTYSANHDDWFDGDGTHLSQNGAAIYTEMIRAALNYTTPVVEVAASDEGELTTDGTAADGSAEGTAADGSAEGTAGESSTTDAAA